jgi:hypothetical protein
VIGNRLLVDSRGDFFVSGLFDHCGKPSPELLQGPADRIFHAFVFHVVNRMIAGGADVIVRVFVKAIKAQNSLSLLLWAAGGDVERQPLIAAAYALSVRDVMHLPGCSIIIGSLFLL